MTILEINSSTVGSTGRIMFMIAKESRKAGYDVYTCSAVHGNEKKVESCQHIYIGGLVSKKIHLFLAKYTGYNGCFSVLATRKFLKKLDELKPDLIHFHNLHNCYINLPMLFNYIKRKNIKVVWTLHDCWAFTGHCPYFDIAKCDRWKTGCGNCPQIERYPYSRIDRTDNMYQLKKKWFTGANITIVTPSRWLAGLVKQSFLKEYPLKVINNGIDLDIFKPSDTSDLRKQKGLEGKFIVLGVANSWEYRKGLDVFLELRKRLDEKYSIILVGLTEKQKAELPDGIIGITRTNNQQELAEIYSMSDIFINPTREENFPTTNIEALACGTGVITFNTGGSPEMLNEKCGIVVEKDDLDLLAETIKKCYAHNIDSQECCSQALKYSMQNSYREYVQLYKKILNTRERKNEH